MTYTELFKIAAQQKRRGGTITYKDKGIERTYATDNAKGKQPANTRAAAKPKSSGRVEYVDSNGVRRVLTTANANSAKPAIAKTTVNQKPTAKTAPETAARPAVKASPAPVGKQTVTIEPSNTVRGYRPIAGHPLVDGNDRAADMERGAWADASRLASQIRRQHGLW